MIRCIVNISISLAAIHSIQALDLTVETSDGNRVIMDVESYQQISEIQADIEQYLDLPIHEQSFLVKGNDYEFIQVKQNPQPDRKATDQMRIYDSAITNNEKSDIRYIVVTLADKSLASLLKYKSSLVEAGDRINHVHPLRFLMCVFTDEELKVGIRNINKRGGWVWSDFVGGINDSLQEEFLRNNLRDDQITDFAKAIGVDSSEIFPVIRKKKWTDFVVHLIKVVPRDNRSGRYDM